MSATALDRGQAVRRLAEAQYDVVVVGAGVNGAAAAWDASLRGLKTLLIDKGDFGGQTSAGCFKIIHGGLRYLQHLDFRRLRESYEEQRLLRIMAPHLVQQLPFLIPCYKPLLKRRATLRLALSVYEALAYNRNAGVQRSLHLPKHRALSREECLSMLPGIADEGLEGAVLYYDVQMHNADRLTFALSQAAAEAGATVCNYLELVGIAQGTDAGIVDEVQLNDLASGKEYSVRTRSVVNATGPWLEHLAYRLGLGPQPPARYSKGVQLAVAKRIHRSAFAVESHAVDEAAQVSRGGRAYFVQPWQQCTLVGTSDELVEEAPDAFEIRSRDVERFLGEFNRAYPAFSIAPEEVAYAFGGLRPVADDLKVSGDDDAAKVARKDLVLDHVHVPFGNTLLNNVVSMRGVKYTTFRLFAERAIDLVCEKIGYAQRSSTASARLPAAPTTELPEYLRALEARFPRVQSSYLRYLLHNYGTAAEEIAADTEEGSTGPLVPGFMVRASEVRYVLRQEMVMHLEDALLRRLPFLQSPADLGAAVPALLPICREELGWSEERCQREQTRLKLPWSGRAAAYRS